MYVKIFWHIANFLQKDASGRVNMREVEITTQYLINDGFDLGTSMDPY
ncbi:MAG: acyl-ACP desaturase, partial [Prevotella melaninogenica]